MKIFNAIEKEEFNVRDSQDRRKKVNRIVVSYIDEAGYEYRKTYVNCMIDGVYIFPKTL